MGVVVGATAHDARMNSNWALLAPYLVVITAVQLVLSAVAKLLSASRFKKIERLSKVIEAATCAATATSLVAVFAFWATTQSDFRDPPTERAQTAESFAILYVFVVGLFVIYAALITFGNLTVRLVTVFITIFGVVATRSWFLIMFPSIFNASFWIIFIGSITWIGLSARFGADRMRRLANGTTSVAERRRQAIITWLEPGN